MLTTRPRRWSGTISCTSEAVIENDDQQRRAGEEQQQALSQTIARQREGGDQHAERDLHDQQRQPHVLEAPEPCDDQRAEHRAGAGERHHAAVAADVAVEDVAREDRQERQQRQPQERRQEREHGQRDDRRLAARRSAAPPFSSCSIGLRSAGGMCLMAQRQQRDDDDEERERRSAPKQAAVPKAASVAPASSGPNTRARLNWIEFSAIAFGRSFFSTSDGTSDWYAGPPNACAEPGDERQRQDVPDADDVPGDTSAASVNAVAICTYCDAEQQVAAIVAVGDDAADQRQQQDRQLAEEVVEAEVERRFGELEDEPALRDLLHPGADRRGEGAEPQDAEIPVGERGERAAEEWLGAAERHPSASQIRTLMRTG